MHDLDFCVGEEAKECGGWGGIPLKNGIIRSMACLSDMESIWQQSFYKYLRCCPDEHFGMLSDPPLNPPEKRMEVAEVMFETFNVSGLYFGSQAVLALAASWNSKKCEQLKLSGSLTGTVVDSGEDVTHIVPVVEGHVISSSVKQVPLRGQDITNFICMYMREREGSVGDQVYQIAKQIKKKYCYVSKDIVKEFVKYESRPDFYHEKYEERKFHVDIGPERFLGPEVFFCPEICSSMYTIPLPVSVDETIRSCPIDNRRGLYGNVVLSGGSMCFKNFDKRLQRDLQRVVWDRAMKKGLMTNPRRHHRPIEVNVISPPNAAYSVWYGGSILAADREFPNVCKTREEYREKGPSCCRHFTVLAPFHSKTSEKC